jgi:putative transposase
MAEYRSPLITGRYYHVFNRGIDKRVTFQKDAEYRRFVRTLNYYNHLHTPLRFSYFIRQNSTVFSSIALETGPLRTTILAYCLLANHYHLLVRQEVDGGISQLISLVENSFTKHSNIANHRIGNLFLDRFRVVPISSESQLLHVSRYIHLNPFAAGVVTSPEELASYPHSSFPEYLSDSYVETVSRPNLILHDFNSREDYKEFVLSRAPLQVGISQIKHANAG